jgi:hypothetical protein
MTGRDLIGNNRLLFVGYGFHKVIDFHFKSLRELDERAVGYIAIRILEDCTHGLVVYVGYPRKPGHTDVLLFRNLPDL